MSEIKVNSIKGVGASAAAITVNNSDGTCTANLSNRQNRNLIINGAMQVAQRDTSSTSSGYQTVDRFSNEYAGADEAPVQSQGTVASGTTPYTLGFRKTIKITNGNQTSGAGTTDLAVVKQIIEAQNIAKSGWNYLSSSSFITLSFWVKSSVAQAFSGNLRTFDGTARVYKFDTASLSADTWTKVTKTIPGNSNLNFADDTGSGLVFHIYPFIGTDYTTSNSDTETWLTASGSNYANDMTSTWWTTDDSTFEITGLQLEVGSVATDFEHLSFPQDLQLCKRYYQLWVSGTDQFVCFGDFFTATQCDGGVQLPVEMRATPSIEANTGSNYYIIYTNSTQSYIDGSLTIFRAHKRAVLWYSAADTARTAGHANRWITINSNAKIAFSAEL